MDNVQRYLFGTFPRSFGNPIQWTVHSESEMDVAINECEGERNLYSSICYFDPVRGVVNDKISIDLDSPLKEAAFPDTQRDNEKVMRMREDHDLAEEVLGMVVEDARKVAQCAADEEIPVVGVFSGMGIHIHLMYQERENAKNELATTVRRYTDILNLETLDTQLIGDVFRILRIPNVRRVYLSDAPDIIDSDTHIMPCNLYTIPLTRDELCNLTVQDLLKWSKKPRMIQLPQGPRPEMQIYDDYYEDRAMVGGAVETEIDVDNYELQGLLSMLKELLQMPCMYERIIQPNPHHFVRLNCAVLLFNAGFSPEEVERMFMSLGWKDSNNKRTRKYLNQIYRKGYSDMSCDTLMSQGLCCRSDDPESCPTFGWSGGECEWQKQ